MLSTRHDEENCVALCKYCHSHFTKNPGEHRDFFVKRLGQKKYDLLEVRARTPMRYRPDDASIKSGFWALLNSMGVYEKRGPALSTFTP